MSWENWNRRVAVAIYKLETGDILRVTTCDAFHAFQQLNEGEAFVEITERLDTSLWKVTDGQLVPRVPEP